MSEAAPNEDKVKETIEKTGYTFVALNTQVCFFFTQSSFAYIMF